MSEYYDPIGPPKSSRVKVFFLIFAVNCVVIALCLVGWVFLVDGYSVSGEVEKQRVSTVSATCKRPDVLGRMPIGIGVLKKVKSGQNEFSVYPGVGPLEMKNGLPSCYQDSQAGATLAAMNIVEGINTPSRVGIIDRFFVGQSVPKIRVLAERENPANWGSQEDTHVLAYKTTLTDGVYRVELFTSTDSGITHIYTLYMKFVQGDMRFLADESATVFKQSVIRIPDDFQQVVSI